uniref:MAK10-like protein n=1 Tax=Tanacetum cinerariifolium TaxID=118510 RepID=A0A699IWB6_TANCI|nr:MAK10-like protein [Tanacetum cinerariifolium]
MGSISTWEDLTTRSLAQFFPPGRTAKLRNDILMFQQHQVNLFLKDRLILRTYFKKSLIMALLKDLALYDNEGWNDPRDFKKPVKAIYLPHDVPNAFDRRLIELENQVQHLMEAYLAPNPPVQVNKIASSCEIYSGPRDTQYCIENPKQAFVDYASSRIDKAGGKWFTFKPKQNNLGDTYNPSWKSHQKLRGLQAFDTLVYSGSIVNLIPLYLFKKHKIGLLEETEDVLGLADGTKSYPVGIVRNVEVHVGKLKFLEDFYVIDMKKDPTCPLLIGRGFLATASTVIDCKKAKIAVGESITMLIFRVKEIDFGVENVPYWTIRGKQESYTP